LHVYVKSISCLFGHSRKIGVYFVSCQNLLRRVNLEESSKRRFVLARFYTPEEIQSALYELRIEPEDGMVTSKEAAAILTWRAGKDGIQHEYPEAAVRTRANRGQLKAAKTGWANLYRVEDIFKLTLHPKRGAKPDPSKEAAQEVS
jgi:hypothetical protein